jgi:hypothetical protein
MPIEAGKIVFNSGRFVLNGIRSAIVDQGIRNRERHEKKLSPAVDHEMANAEALLTIPKPPERLGDMKFKWQRPVDPDHTPMTVPQRAATRWDSWQAGKVTRRQSQSSRLKRIYGGGELAEVEEQIKSLALYGKPPTPEMAARHAALSGRPGDGVGQDRQAFRRRMQRERIPLATRRKAMKATREVTRNNGYLTMRELGLRDIADGLGPKGRQLDATQQVIDMQVDKLDSIDYRRGAYRASIRNSRQTLHDNRVQAKQDRKVIRQQAGRRFIQDVRTVRSGAAKGGQWVKAKARHSSPPTPPTP